MFMVMLTRMFLLAALALAPLSAAAAPLSPDEVVQAEVLPGWQTAAGTQMAALHLHLADHWKTYWRSPGDAGVPPAFDWTGSQNLQKVSFHWPRPTVFNLNGMESVGYTHDLVLPIEFTPQAPGQPVTVKATVDIGVCNDICMPVQLQLNAVLQGAGAPNPAIQAALAEVPTPAAKAGVTGFTCSVSPIKDGVHLTARIALPPQGGQETALFESADPAIWVGDTQTSRQGGVLVAGADLVPSEAAPFALDRSKLTITVLGQEHAVELRGCPAG
jgi:DsbC/DsbD-like thiol-disulfide interchange protein